MGDGPLAWQVSEPARTVTFNAVPHLDITLFAGLSLIVVLFLILGWRWRHIGLPTIDERRKRIAQADTTSRQALLNLQVARVTAGVGTSRFFRVEARPPVGMEALCVSADLMGRIHRWSDGREIDVIATMDRSIAAGGQFTPVMFERRVTLPIVVLLDVEMGDHPYLARLRGLIGAWRSHGLDLQVFTFQGNPGIVWDESESTPLPLDAVARRTGGQALLLLSRRMTVAGQPGLRPWIASLASWSPRAWIDPDPLAMEDSQRRETAAYLGHTGTRRFPLCDDGVIAAAAWLNGRDAVADVPDPTLPGPSDEALEMWAHAAARVPMPTWEQLEALRREIPELSSALPGPHAVAWLLRWARRRPENKGRDVTDRGDMLFQSDALVSALMATFHDKVATKQVSYEFARKVDRLLLKQLRLAPPSVHDHLNGPLYEFKVGVIQARLHPRQATQIYTTLLEGPFREKILTMLREEYRFQENAPSGVAWPVEDREIVAGIIGPDDTLRLTDLWSGASDAWPSWERVVVWWVMLVGVGILGALLPGWLGRMGIGFSWLGTLPETYLVDGRSPLAATEYRPEMIEIVSAEKKPQGSAPPGYLMAVTEVTQSQFQSLMGWNPSVPKVEGILLTGDYLPVQNVSWYDAIFYCLQLSKEEGLEPAYTLMDSGDVAWNREADGYRLPTEAEWLEVAAKKRPLAGLGSPSIEFYDGPSPVASYRPNPYGLFDVVGNVYEWTWGSDGHHDSSTRPCRVAMGGAWDSQVFRSLRESGWCRDPTEHDYRTGFRPVRGASR